MKAWKELCPLQQALTGCASSANQAALCCRVGGSKHRHKWLFPFWRFTSADHPADRHQCCSSASTSSTDAARAKKETARRGTPEEKPRLVRCYTRCSAARFVSPRKEHLRSRYRSGKDKSITLELARYTKRSTSEAYCFVGAVPVPHRGMTSSWVSERPPDYFIGANGIPQPRKMERGSTPTHPSKLNKCLYNLTVRNGPNRNSNNCRNESDIAIRGQYSGKSSSTGNHSSNTSGVASNRQNNWRRPSTVTSPPNCRRICTNTSIIPRTSSEVNSSSIRLITSNGRTPTLLSSREHRNGTHAAAINIHLMNGYDCGANFMSQCR